MMTPDPTLSILCAELQNELFNPNSVVSRADRIKILIYVYTDHYKLDI